MLLLSAVALGALAGCTTSTLDKGVEARGSASYAATRGAAARDDLELVRPGASEGGIRVVASLPARSAADGGQTISADDLLEIDVFQVDELDRSVRVDARGMVSLPLIGDVKASGLSSRELEGELQRRYGADYLESPQISVFVRESAAQRATVDGEVRKAGLQPVTNSTSLVDAIAQAGGLTDIADPTKIFVFRQAGEEKLVARYDLKAIRSGKAPDPSLEGGDVVVVFGSSSKIAMRNLRQVLGVATGARGIVP